MGLRTYLDRLAGLLGLRRSRPERQRLLTPALTRREFLKIIGVGALALSLKPLEVLASEPDFIRIEEEPITAAELLSSEYKPKGAELRTLQEDGRIRVLAVPDADWYLHAIVRASVFDPKARASYTPTRPDDTPLEKLAAEASLLPCVLPWPAAAIDSAALAEFYNEHISPGEVSLLLDGGTPRGLFAEEAAAGRAYRAGQVLVVENGSFRPTGAVLVALWTKVPHYPGIEDEGGRYFIGSVPEIARRHGLVDAFGKLEPRVGEVAERWFVSIPDNPQSETENPSYRGLCTSFFGQRYGSQVAQHAAKWALASPLLVIAAENDRRLKETQCRLNADSSAGWHQNVGADVVAQAYAQAERLKEMLRAELGTKEECGLFPAVLLEPAKVPRYLEQGR